MRKLIVIFGFSLLLSSCSDNQQSEIGQISLVASFEPAFAEHADIIFSSNKDVQKLSILIKSNYRIRPVEDTFFYIEKGLTARDVRLLDSILIKSIRLSTITPENQGFDGMNILFSLVENGDSVNRCFWSPDKVSNPVGFSLTSNAIRVYKTIFRDPIVSDYFDDIYRYIDDSTVTYPSGETALFKLRKKKYGLR